MKIRKGFVSNSSTSSFTCDICNRTVAGMDMGLVDAGMVNCKNGHEYCEDHATKWEPTWEERRTKLLSGWSFTSKEHGRNRHLLPAFNAAKTEEEYEALLEEHDLEGWDEPEDGKVPARACPICTFGKVYERDAFLYLLKVSERTEADLLTELSNRFNSYDELKAWTSQ